MRKTLSSLVRLSALLLLVALLSGCGYRQPEPSDADLCEVGTVGSYTVTYDELYYLAMTYRAVLEDQYGADIFSTPESAKQYREELETLVYRNITANYAILTLAAEIGYKEADVAHLVDQSLEELVTSLGGMHEYRVMLHENYMTDHFVRKNYAVNLLQNNVFNSYVEYLGLIESDAEVICNKILNGSRYARTRHIAVFRDNGKSDEENRALMGSLKAQLDAGADFDALVSQYGEDNAQTSDGYYFMRGEMQEAYEDAAFALKEGEISEVVEAEDGFYLIMRLEKQTEYVMMNCYGVGAPLYENYQKYTFLSMIDEKQAELTFHPNGFGASVDLTSLRQKTFFDGEYLLVILGMVLVGIALAALIAWWIVVSIRADRREKEAKKTRKKQNKRK